MPITGDRREAIRQLLHERPVASQEELLALLAARGIRATQPVISRDLRALGAVKQDGRYVLLEPERVTPLEELGSLLRGAAPAGEHLVVVRCEAGAASAVARALEAEELDGVVGTVAGDDTIFVAVESRPAGRAVLERLRPLV